MSNKSYRMSVSDGCDKLKIYRGANSESFNIGMETNGYDNGMVTIRSKEQVEALMLMLNQALMA